jgi:hypothetical protein
LKQYYNSAEARALCLPGHLSDHAYGAALETLVDSGLIVLPTGSGAGGAATGSGVLSRSSTSLAALAKQRSPLKKQGPIRDQQVIRLAVPVADIQAAFNSFDDDEQPASAASSSSSSSSSSALRFSMNASRTACERICNHLLNTVPLIPFDDS